MDKIEEFLHENKFFVDGQIGGYAISVNDAKELIQLVREECKPEWIPVDGYKEVPEGLWLVKMEEGLCGNEIQTMKVDGRMAVIGTAFAFDVPKVIAYRKIP